MPLTQVQSGMMDSVAQYYSFKNRIINGAMVIDQRNNGASVNMSSGAYPVDRWVAFEDTDGTMTAQRSSVAPAGFINSVLITTTSADSSLAAAQYARIFQSVEGLNVADLAWGTASAATVTLSFWVQSSLTGTFGGSVYNSAFNRSYPFSYTISAANTWEQKTVTIPGDTTGTWLTTNGIGLGINFGLGTGSTFSGTAGAWAGSGLLSATGATSVVGTSGATFYITGVQLEKGVTATSFDYRPYTTELQLCQRYYYRTAGLNGTTFGSGFSNSTTLAQIYTQFPVSMRASPTALEQSGTASHYRVYIGASVTCSAVPLFGDAGQISARTTFTVASGLTTNQGNFGMSNSDSAYLGWSAEL
jgi:hypothetical protein